MGALREDEAYIISRTQSMGYKYLFTCLSAFDVKSTLKQHKPHVCQVLNQTRGPAPPPVIHRATHTHTHAQIHAHEREIYSQGHEMHFQTHEIHPQHQPFDFRLPVLLKKSSGL